jgi:hypothetical protein
LTSTDTPESTLIELRIAKAYVRLCAISENSSDEFVSLASIGSHEIRLLAGSEIDADGVPLFWLELFDHNTKGSIDSFVCHRIKDAVPVFCEFLSQMQDTNATDQSS